MKKSNKTSGSSNKLQGRHFVGAGIAVGMLYIILPLLYMYYISLNSSIWVPFELVILINPITWIVIFIWFLVCYKVLARLGWSAPGKALILSFCASLAVGQIINANTPNFREITGYPQITPYTHIFVMTVFILLLLSRNLNRKHTNR